MQNWNNMWDPMFFLQALYCKELLYILCAIILIALYRSVCSYCKSHAGGETVLDKGEKVDRKDEDNMRYDVLILRIDALCTTISNLERDMRALRRQCAKQAKESGTESDSDTEDEDYKPTYTLYHTGSGTKLHSDLDCRYVSGKETTELSLDEPTYAYLGRCGALCRCDE